MRTTARTGIGTMILLFGVLAASAVAQSTEFTYQGTIRDGGQPANGVYDLEFALFDAASDGNQIGSTIAKQGTQVTDGSFTVSLDFGFEFPGTDRFLEIRIRQAGGSDLMTLAPRQRISSAPYAVRSLSAETATTADNALMLGGTAASEFVTTDDIRLSDARDPLPGSNDYIQNSASVQPGASFNVSGDGKAEGTLSGGIVNSGAQYNIAGNRVLSIPGMSNLFVGIGTGAAIAEGNQNSFFGANAGNANTTGSGNSFFGFAAGEASVSGWGNSFFGSNAGRLNVIGSGNTFVGFYAGVSNTSGSFNSIFGESAGSSNTTGGYNAFFGNSAGRHNTTGSGNTMIGVNAGFENISGWGNTMVGESAGRSNTGGGQNAFFGGAAGYSNTIGNQNAYFGGGAGYKNTTGSANSFSGFNAGFNNTTGSGNAFFGFNAGFNNTESQGNSFYGTAAGYSNTTGSWNAFFGESAGLSSTTAFYNAFFGNSAGRNTTTGGLNTLVGINAGWSTETGFGNSFVGFESGRNNTTGYLNTSIGAYADVANVDLSNATSIGANSYVSQSNSMVLGSINGVNDATADTNVGIGTTAPAERLHVVGNGRFQGNLTVTGAGTNGNGTFAGTLTVQKLGLAGATALCRNASEQIATCSSSIRYKSNIESYLTGTEILDRLRPVTFNWKDSGALDIGLVAEEVADIDPLLVTVNTKGQVEGVKYDRIGVVLVNVVKEQQRLLQIQSEKLIMQNERIGELETKLSAQERQLEALKALVCADRPDAAICQ